MKVLYYGVGLVIPASLLVFSWIIAEEPYFTNVSSTSSHTLQTQSGDYATDVTSLSDPYVDKQWALGQVQAPALWQITRGDSEIIVAVLDTGVDSDHEDLYAKVVAEVSFTDSPTWQDVHGHGTHVAGIIVASSDNGKGITGLAPESRIMNVKVAADDGRCKASEIARGIIWAVDNGANVINISLELKEPSAELENAVNYAWYRGAVVIAAAGNNGDDLPVYPACYENSIAVAATKQDNTLAPLSNHGDWIDLTAPGYNIYSTLPGDCYGYKSGTSFATAYASGMAALLFNVVTDENNDGRLNDEVRAALEAGYNETGGIDVGTGRISAIQSLTYLNYNNS